MVSSAHAHFTWLSYSTVLRRYTRDNNAFPVCSLKLTPNVRCFSTWSCILGPAFSPLSFVPKFHVLHFFFFQSTAQLQYVEDSEPVTRSTWPLVNSAKNWDAILLITVKLTVCLNGSDLICHTVANVLVSVNSLPPGKHLAAVCPRGPDSVPCRL